MSETNDLAQNIVSEITEKNDLSADELFKQGKKFYIIGEFSKALEFLTKSCKLKESKVGSLSDEMFEVYFYLAKSYLMYSKVESDVLGEKLENYKDENDNLENITEEDCESDTPDNDIPVANELVENHLKILNNSEEGQQELEKDENNANINEDESERDLKTMNKMDIEAECSDVKCDSEDGKDSEALTYLQLSYETMECAKLILNRQITESKSNLMDLELKLADCCNVVGNIYMEEGITKEAVNEYMKALELNQKHAVINDRAVAESFFNLALAYLGDAQFSEAIIHFEKCKTILVECRIACVVNGADDPELASILQEINAKIIECKEGERDYELAKKSIKDFMTVARSDLPINEISHLVKRKNSEVSNDTSVEPAGKIQKFEPSDQ